MRPIKFRIWDKKEKKWMLGYELLDGFNLLGEIVMLGELSAIPLSKLNDLEVMQFTGLYDKNGKEIYEGDILHQAGTKSNKYGRKLKVFWRDELAGFFPFIHDQKQHDVKYKIIGNIWENPSLLNNQN